MKTFVLVLVVSVWNNAESRVSVSNVPGYTTSALCQAAKRQFEEATTGYMHQAYCIPGPTK